MKTEILKSEETKFYFKTMKMIFKYKKQELQNELKTVKENIEFCKKEIKKIGQAKRVSD